MAAPASGKTSAAYTLRTLYNRHLNRGIQEALFGATLLADLGDQVPLPGHSGKKIYLPRDIPKNTVRALTAESPIQLCGTSGYWWSGTVTGYGDAKGYSDFLVSINEIPAMISKDIMSMTRYLGYKYDSVCRAIVSGAGVGTWVSPDGSTAQGAVVEGTNLLQRFLFDASTVLASNDAPTYSDGNYHGVFHPRQVHDLFVNTSGGSQLRNVAHGQVPGFLENTELGARKLERATIGVLGNVRVLTSTQSSKFLYTATDQGTASIGGMESGLSGYQGLVMGPGAFASVNLSNQRPRVFIKGFGSAGTADAINQVTSVGIKGYFTAIAKDTTNRLVRTASGKTL